MQGDKVTARIGGNLNIETLQEKETYEEQNTSTGFGISWNVNMTKTKTTGPNKESIETTTRSFAKPNIGGSFSKGNISSHYKSARDQAGIFAGIGGFDLLVGKNTDLKGALIASKAPADKNKLSTGTLSFSDLENEADYHAKDSGSTAQIKPTLRRIKETGPAPNKSTEKLKIVQGLSISPTIPTEVQGSASSTTKSAVAPGTIDIRENPTQDISALSRNTENALNELGRIFDKKKIEEQQELAAVFGEEAFRLVHKMKDDGSGRKIAVHAIIGGIMSQITGAGFASGAVGAGLNEALINAVKGKDPGTAQIVSAILGAAAAKVAGGSAAAGASATATGTKWNLELDDHSRNIRQEEYQDILQSFDADYVAQLDRGNPYSDSEAAEALQNLYNALNNANRIGLTPLAGELLEVFLDQDFSGHGIVNVDYTKHGYPVLEFGAQSLVNERLRNASFNERIVYNAIMERINNRVATPTDTHSYTFYLNGIDNALGLGNASAIISFRVNHTAFEAKVTITDNWDHGKNEAMLGSFFRDAYIVQQSGLRRTFAYKTTYDLSYPITDLFHE